MSHTLPFFSVIIPTYARPKRLTKCLHAIAQLNYPAQRFEVIVVDDGSPEALDDIVSPFHSQLNLTLLVQQNVGPAAARNRGVRRARGKFLAFTDDDCLPDRDWLRALESQFIKTPNRIIGGRTINLLTDNIYSTASQIIVNVVYRHYNARPEQSRFLATNNLALPAHLFHSISGFNSDFITAEDREFCDRSLHRGFQMTYVPDAVVYHAHSLEFSSFCKQHFNYGRGAFRFHLTRALRGSGNSLREFEFHLNLSNWLLYPFSQVRGWKKIRLEALLFVWQIVNAAGFFWEMLNETFKRISPKSYNQEDVSGK